MNGLMLRQPGSSWLRRGLAAVVVLLVLGVPSMVRADQLTTTGMGPYLQGTVMYNGSPVDGTNGVLAGVIMGSLNGGPSFPMFCVDLYGVVSTSGTSYDVSVLKTTSLSSVWDPSYPTLPTTPPPSRTIAISQTQAAEIAYLTNTYAWTGDAEKAAAAQTAIWELAYGSTVAFLPGGSDSPDFDKLVCHMLWKAEHYADSSVAVYLERNTTGTDGQDMVSPVPEPPSVLLLTLGLVGAFGVYYRRPARKV